MIVTSMKELRNQEFSIHRVRILKETWEKLKPYVWKDMNECLSAFYIEYDEEMCCYDIYCNKYNFKTIYDRCVKEG